MLTNPHFPELMAHDDASFARLLGADVVSRSTIHEWPLSWVQRLSLDDGRVLVYKSQLPPTVEAAFYREATSSLLTGFLELGELGNCSTMIIDWIDAPSLDSLGLDEREFVEHGERIVAQIGSISGSLPVYFDIGSPLAWRWVVAEALGKLRELVDNGAFPSVTSVQVDAVRAWSESEAVIDAVSSGTRPIHADLRADQAFVLPDGYRVVDWQRPILAPASVDLVMLLDQQGIDPRRYTSPAMIGIRWFVLLRWAVECQHDLLPDLDSATFDEWAASAIGDILAGTS
jgi:hypothetical protein